jgi:hypothetical protein
MADDLENIRAKRIAAQASEDFAQKLNNASKELSGLALDNVVAKFGKLAKATDLLSDKQKDGIDSIRGVQKVLKELEDQADKIREIEKERIGYINKNKKSSEALFEANVAATASLIKIGVESRAAAANFVKNFDALEKNSAALLESRRNFDKMNKSVIDVIDGYKKQVASFFTIEKGTQMMVRGLKETYAQLERLSGKGLLNTIVSINRFALSLQMLPKDFEEIIDRNRALIVGLGGGTKGIAEFADQVKEASKGLEYLGAGEAQKAGARMVEVAKAFGLRAQDGDAYKKQIQTSTKQFKLFNGLFGDTSEQYSKLYEQLESEETYRRKLNGLSKDQIQLEASRQSEAVTNLKLMGMSNDEIVSFTAKLNQFNDPSKNTIGRRQSEAAMGRATLGSMERALSGSDKEDFEKNVMPGITRILEAERRSPQEGTAALTDKDNAEALKKLGIYRSKVEQKAPNTITGYQANVQKAGQQWSLISQASDAAATGERKGQNFAGKSPEELATIADKSSGADNSPLSMAFRGLSDAVALEQTMTHGMTGALVGATAALIGFSISLVKASLLNAALGGGGPGGKIGKIAELANFAKGAGARGMISTAGSTAAEIAGMDVLGVDGLLAAGTAGSATVAAAVLAAGAVGYGAGTALDYGIDKIGHGATIGSGAYDTFGAKAPAMGQAADYAADAAMGLPAKRAAARQRLGQQANSADNGGPKQMSGSASAAISFFKSKGWTQEQAAGIAANLQSESNFNPAADGDSHLAYGIAQWHPDRQANFQALMGKPIRGSSFQEQLEFVNWELNNTHKRAGDKLRNAGQAGQAGAIVSKYYEGPKAVEEAMRNRAAQATQLSASYTATQMAAPPSTGSVSGSSMAPAPTGDSGTAEVVDTLHKVNNSVKELGKPKPFDTSKPAQTMVVNGG